MVKDKPSSWRVVNVYNKLNTKVRNAMQVLIWSLRRGMPAISSPQYLCDEASLMLQR